MFCSKCGNKLAQGSKFCSKCGAQVPVVVAPKVQQPGTLTPAVVPQPKAPVAAPVSQNESVPQPKAPVSVPVSQNESVPRPTKASVAESKQSVASMTQKFTTPMPERPKAPISDKPAQAMPKRPEVPARPTSPEHATAGPKRTPYEATPAPKSYGDTTSQHTTPAGNVNADDAKTVPAPGVASVSGMTNGASDMVIKKKKSKKGLLIGLLSGGGGLLLLILIAIIIASGNSSSGEPIGDVVTHGDGSLPAQVDSTIEKTVMIYLVGSNLESEYSAASRDIEEMINSGVDTDKNNILVFTGGSKQWHSSSIAIPADKNCVYRLNGDSFELVQSFSDENMGDAETLSKFIDYSKTNYAADKYGLILWNHGGGPFIGYGHDEKFDDMMLMSEITDALSSSGFGSGEKLEFVGFDACLMGSMEVAWCLSDYANYMVASQEVEPGTGWDYKFLENLNYYDDGRSIGITIIDSYFKSTDTTSNELTLACLDLSKVKDVEGNINSLFKEVDLEINNGGFPEISRHRNNTKTFGKFSTSSDYDLIDLRHIATLLQTDYNTQATALIESIDGFVCYTNSNVSNASGVSIYHPYDNKSCMDGWVKDFEGFAFASSYAEYISDFSKYLKASSSNSWTAFGKVAGTATKSGSDRELAIMLTEEQVKNYAGAKYYILKKMDNGEYLFVFAGSDVELADNGTLSATYNGKAVFSVDKKTGEVSHAPITMYQVDDGTGEMKYTVTSMFWDSAAIPYPVEWQLKINDGEPMLGGAYLITDEDDNIPQKQLLDYKDYDIVEFSFSTRKPKKDKNGNLLPYFQWDSTGNFYGHQYNVSDGFTLECREIENNEDYVVMFVVKDTQGNSFASKTFTLPE